VLGSAPIFPPDAAEMHGRPLPGHQADPQRASPMRRRDEGHTLASESTAQLTRPQMRVILIASLGGLP
jgi:hypothetical protein